MIFEVHDHTRQFSSADLSEFTLDADLIRNEEARKLRACLDQGQSTLPQEHAWIGKS